MKKKYSMLSAIQPTGVFTLGNYIGAIKNWRVNQEKFNCIYFIANLHSLTIRQNPEQFKNITLNCVALLIACGIDPKKSLIFIQSQVPQHTELAWILQCFTQFGELNRMTQFKDKSLKNAKNVNAGLFCYPSLMASDILLYEPDYVPIGADQKQHLELTRTIANRFNQLYGKTFKLPQVYMTEIGNKIKSLSNPICKMSKSDVNQNGVIYILDEAEVILNKLKKANTDSENSIKLDYKNKPGISNLLEIYASLSNLKIQEVENLFKTSNYSTLKTEVAKKIINELKPIQQIYKDLLNNPKNLNQICIDSAIQAKSIAKSKIKEVKLKLGII